MMVGAQAMYTPIATDMGVASTGAAEQGANATYLGGIFTYLFSD